MYPIFRSILCGFYLALLAIPVSAQQTSGENQRPSLPSPSVYADRMVNLLSGKMELSDQQMDSVNVVFIRFMDAQIIAMQTRDRETMMRLREERDKVIRLILRDEKKIQAYNTIIQEQSVMRRGTGGNNR